jgi:hypothetical protein
MEQTRIPRVQGMGKEIRPSDVVAARRRCGHADDWGLARRDDEMTDDELPVPDPQQYFCSLHGTAVLIHGVSVARLLSEHRGLVSS